MDSIDLSFVPEDQRDAFLQAITRAVLSAVKSSQTAPKKATPTGGASSAASSSSSAAAGAAAAASAAASASAHVDADSAQESGEWKTYVAKVAGRAPRSQRFAAVAIAAADATTAIKQPHFRKRHAPSASAEKIILEGDLYSPKSERIFDMGLDDETLERVYPILTSTKISGVIKCVVATLANWKLRFEDGQTLEAHTAKRPDLKPVTLTIPEKFIGEHQIKIAFFASKFTLVQDVINASGQKEIISYRQLCIFSKSETVDTDGNPYQFRIDDVLDALIEVLTE